MFAKVHERRNTNAVRCKEGKWWESVTQCTHEGNVLERGRGEGGGGEETIIFSKIKFFNIGIHKKTDINEVMLTLTSIFLKKPMLTYHLPTLVF